MRKACWRRRTPSGGLTSIQISRSRGAADGDPQLIDGQPFAQAEQTGIAAQPPLLLHNLLDMTPGIKNARGVKVETLRLGNGQDRGPHGFRDERGRRLLQCDQGESLASRQQFQKLVEFRTRRGGAIEDLIRRIVFDFSLARASWPFLLFDQRIEVPDAVDEFRNAVGDCADW